MSARQVYTGFKSAPFREAVQSEPIGDHFQQLIDRCENPDRVKPKTPASIEADPELAARRRERLQFADTVPMEQAVADDDQPWIAPTRISVFSLVVLVLLSVASVASCLQGIAKVGADMRTIKAKIVRADGVRVNVTIDNTNMLAMLYHLGQIYPEYRSCQLITVKREQARAA